MAAVSINLGGDIKMEAKYTVGELLKEVLEMRECQRYFFGTRDKKAVPIAMEREKRVDAILKNVNLFGFKEEK